MSGHRIPWIPAAPRRKPLHNCAALFGFPEPRPARRSVWRAALDVLAPVAGDLARLACALAFTAGVVMALDALLNR